MSAKFERRPLIVTDCDEVILHMVVPFREWLDETRGIHFDFSRGSFVESLRHKHDGTLVDAKEIWPLLDGFFVTEMHRQSAMAGAVEAINALAAVADVQVLTNLTDEHNAARREQLKAVGIDCPVHTNQGGKGVPLKLIAEAHGGGPVFFVDDLATHHESVARHAPHVWRIHMVGEPELAPHYPPAPFAHARIDNWAEARAWIEARIAEGVDAPLDTTISTIAGA